MPLHGVGEKLRNKSSFRQQISDGHDHTFIKSGSLRRCEASASIMSERTYGKKAALDHYSVVVSRPLLWINVVAGPLTVMQ